MKKIKEKTDVGSIGLFGKESYIRKIIIFGRNLASDARSMKKINDVISFGFLLCFYYKGNL